MSSHMFRDTILLGSGEYVVTVYDDGTVTLAWKPPGAYTFGPPSREVKP